MEVDEGFEARAALRLALRGYAAAALAGAAWYAPLSGAAGLLAGAVTVALACVAFLPLVPASVATRNILCRQIGLRGRPRLVVAFGLVLGAAAFTLAALLFRLMRHLYGA